MPTVSGWAAGEPVAAADINSYLLRGSRNVIINGDMRVNQRVATSGTDDTYTLDRWTLLSDAATITVAQSTVAPTDGLYSFALTPSTTNKKFGIIQFVEQQNCVGLFGQSVTLSFKARVSSLTNLDNVKCAILAWSGTADTVTSDVVSAWGVEGTNPTLATSWTYENTPANLNVTTTWATYRVTAAFDTASAKNIAVFIWSDVTTVGTGDTLYITDVQLEGGAIATPFERRLFSDELILCQRYYEKSYALGTSPATATNESSVTSSYIYGYTTTSWIGTSSAYKVTKFRDPDVTVYDIAGNSGKVTRETAGVAADDNQPVTVSVKSGVNNIYVDSSGTANRASINFHFVAVAEL